MIQEGAAGSEQERDTPGEAVLPDHRSQTSSALGQEPLGERAGATLQNCSPQGKMEKPSGLRNAFS